MTQALTETYAPALRDAIESLEIALPAPGDRLEQDEEWVVVHTKGTWKKVRLHDYADVFQVQGLYEKWVYDIFGCRSPHKVARHLMSALRKASVKPEALTVLDLGAGNGYVADVLSQHGVERFVGADIYPEAATAADRDRPGLYEDFVVGDITPLEPEQQSTLESHDFNCLTCVAALGFGDIPPEVFIEAYNHVADGGWVAFTIKTDFTSEKDKSGFSRLIRRMVRKGLMSVEVREPFTHRKSTDGEDLVYEAFIGRKQGSVPSEWLPEREE